GGTATIDGADFAQTALLGEISGGNLAFTSSGTIPALFVLGGHNTHGDTLIGPNAGGALADGTLGTGNVIFDPAAADPLTPAVLLFAHTSDYAYGGTIAGPGAIAVSTAPGATITLSGSNTAALNYTGTVVVNGG